jgi:hypothetical protein
MIAIEIKISSGFCFPEILKWRDGGLKLFRSTALRLMDDMHRY